MSEAQRIANIETEAMLMERIAKLEAASAAFYKHACSGTYRDSAGMSPDKSPQGEDLCGLIQEVLDRFNDKPVSRDTNYHQGDEDES